jgi:hypothetical protein
MRIEDLMFNSIILFTLGLERPHVFEGSVDLPYLFVDKQVIAVTIKDVYLNAPGVLPFTYCEVYAPLGINTNVCIISGRGRGRGRSGVRNKACTIIQALNLSI